MCGAGQAGGCPELRVLGQRQAAAGHQEVLLAVDARHGVRAGPVGDSDIADVPTDVPDTPAPTPSPPAATPDAEQTPVATPQPVPPRSPDPTATVAAVPVAMAPTAAPPTQAPAARPTQAPLRPSPAAAIGAEAQSPQEAATPAPLKAQVANAPQRPEVVSIPEVGAAAPTPSAAQVQVQASQAGPEPTAAPPPAEPQGGIGCNASLRGSSASVSGIGDLMLLGTVVGSLLVSSRLRRRR